nr:immunoglobulin light chain junction region [Macaca mulatta]MOX78656.1 immunoglobulin light chain junction region [Macaca mulatta]MOX79330.1 immunoglobulin light chain junction region [Macaca mulatta]MOX82916.1 immunoglobulin light chain junction region [Macaca mulatta]MOX82941.1 immunoglobulin light chain junction region [Macaca mulatta]
EYYCSSDAGSNIF